MAYLRPLRLRLALLLFPEIAGLVEELARAQAHERVLMTQARYGVGDPADDR